MDKTEKLFEAQRYFAFKIIDYTNNAFHAFESKALESIEYYMLKCLETYEEIQTSISGDKLTKAYRSLLAGLNTLLKIHPFGMTSFYCSDFTRLRNLLPSAEISQGDSTKNPDKGYLDVSIYTSIKSLYKKYHSTSICRQYVDILTSTDTFMVVDNTIEFLISDLLYRGFSFCYLKNWFSSHYVQNNDFFIAMEAKNIFPYIQQICEFDMHETEFYIGIKYTLKHEYKDNFYSFLKRKFGFSEEAILQDKERSGDWGSDENAYYLFQKVKALDVYKAIHIAEQAFDSAATTFYTVKLPNTMKVSKGKICVAGHTTLEEYNLSTINRATELLWVDGKERDQLSTYMELSLSTACEMDTLGRVITTIKNARELDQQNQFLNSWSALEYLLYAYPKNSIIEKVRDIIPKSSSLYYIKDKLNWFWARLKYFCSNTKNSGCINTIRLCNDCTKIGSEYEYNTKELLSFFSNETWEKEVLQELSRNVILKRQLMELDVILKKSEHRSKLIKQQKEKIEADLNLIYRLRNQMVHSSTSSDIMLEYIGLRLFRYVNSLLATILYYKSKNNATTIAEVLNSIDCTYEWYLVQIKEDLDATKYLDIVRPTYLFLD